MSNQQNICNICGANYEYRNGRWMCPACGAYKPEEITNEEMSLIYSADQKLRFSEFEDAEREFDDIVRKYPNNHAGYWGRLRARYGIKYEEDFDGRRIPTCCATSIDSFIGDSDYKRAIEFADRQTADYYREQAEYIERVRREWVEKARKEKPYDIFICYKDSDLGAGIQRTKDSYAVQELYIHLQNLGYRVFYSRESLRDKIGEKYEPYIFNALSTAKVMIVYSTSAEYIQSTWLKNEWLRFSKKMAEGEKKENALVVAYADFDPIYLPKPLSSMQCMDATKLSFYGDLEKHIDRIINGDKKKKVAAVAVEDGKRKKKRFSIAPLLWMIFGVAATLFAIVTILKAMNDSAGNYVSVGGGENDYNYDYGYNYGNGFENIYGNEDPGVQEDYPSYNVNDLLNLPFGNQNNTVTDTPGGFQVIEIPNTDDVIDTGSETETESPYNGNKSWREDDSDGSYRLCEETYVDGRVTLSTVAYYNADGSLDITTVSELDQNGNVKKRATILADGTMSVEKYDSSGDVTERTEYYSNGNIKTKTEYNNGKITKQSEYYSNGKIQSVSEHSNDKLIRVTYYREDGTKSVCEYNSFGTISRQTEYDSNGQITVWWDMEYDSNGNHIKTTWYNPDGSIRATDDKITQEHEHEWSTINIARGDDFHIRECTYDECPYFTAYDHNFGMGDMADICTDCNYKRHTHSNSNGVLINSCIDKNNNRTCDECNQVIAKIHYYGTGTTCIYCGKTK